MLHAKMLGLKNIVTEHTFFSFQEVGDMTFNKLLKWYCLEVDHSICVSHASKDNLVLRGKIDPLACSVIPNGVDSEKFVPNPCLRYPVNRINIVVM